MAKLRLATSIVLCGSSVGAKSTESSQITLGRNTLPAIVLLNSEKLGGDTNQNLPFHIFACAIAPLTKRLQSAGVHGIVQKGLLLASHASGIGRGASCCSSMRSAIVNFRE